MTTEIKYTSDVDAGSTARCAEILTGCETKATSHICFEDGSGEYVCQKCFDKRVNEGNWITDATEHLLAF